MREHFHFDEQLQNISTTLHMQMQMSFFKQEQPGFLMETEPLKNINGKPAVTLFQEPRMARDIYESTFRWLRRRQ